MEHPGIKNAKLGDKYAVDSETEESFYYSQGVTPWDEKFEPNIEFADSPFHKKSSNAEDEEAI